MTNHYRVLSAALAVVISLQSVSCGTLLYPERRNQKGERLDVGVVLLDAIGLLFFLIPGIIAFAVDFSTGAIYLPPTLGDKLSSVENGMRVVRFDPKNYTPQMLEEIIRRETGKDFHFSDERLQKVELKDKSAIPVYLAQFENASLNRLSLLK